MTRPGRSLTLSISDLEKAQLEQLALDFDQTWGDKPNISRLIQAIARGHLRVAFNHDWSQERITTLNLIRNYLIDAGHHSEALALATLLLERSELNHPLRQEIQRFVDQPGAPWRRDIEASIRRQRPFSLTYQDTTGQIRNFSIRYAKIVTFEEREYLTCWCDQTTDNQDLPELAHNWVLRLDRIPEETVIGPLAGPWQPELAFIDVEIHLSGRLALAYRSKTGRDLVNEWDPDRQIRRVVRHINHSFWLLREVRRYGPDCLIHSPATLRDLMMMDLKHTLQAYEKAQPG
ncbi:MAG: helix-turn-helix transcriptional regulator [Nodosilinea sp.]